MTKEQLQEGVARLLREASANDDADDRAVDGAAAQITASEMTDEEAAELARWEALSFQTADEGERRVLRQEAATSNEGARRFEAYRPLDQPIKERLLEKVQQELRRSREPEIVDTGLDSKVDPKLDSGPDTGSDTGPDTEDDTADDTADDIELENEDEPSHQAELAPTIPFPAIQTPRRRADVRRRTWWLTPALATLAATLLVVVMWPRPPIELPEYELTAQSGRLDVRGQAPAVDQTALDQTGVDETLRLAPGDRFEIVLRPAFAVEQALSVAVFAQRPGGLEPVDLAADFSETGSVRLEGLFDDQLRKAQDEVTLLVVVAPRGALPDAAELGDSGNLEPDRRWRLLRCRLEREPTSEI